MKPSPSDNRKDNLTMKIKFSGDSAAEIETLRQATLFASDDKSRPSITWVKFEHDDDGALRLTATNAYIAAQILLPLRRPCDEFEPFGVNAKQLAAFCAHVPPNDRTDDLCIDITKENVTFSATVDGHSTTSLRTKRHDVDTFTDVDKVMEQSRVDTKPPTKTIGLNPAYTSLFEQITSEYETLQWHMPSDPLLPLRVTVGDRFEAILMPMRT